jgi:hypothetical protein
MSQPSTALETGGVVIRFGLLRTPDGRWCAPEDSNFQPTDS